MISEMGWGTERKRGSLGLRAFELGSGGLGRLKEAVWSSESCLVWAEAGVSVGRPGWPASVECHSRA